jgi:hypothetical protein
MNFVRCKKESIKLENGETKSNKMLNLNAVIQINLKESVDKSKKNEREPMYYALEFECVDGKSRIWYFNTRREMHDTHNDLKQYILSKSK